MNRILDHVVITLFLSIAFISGIEGRAQTIIGEFPMIAGKQIKLSGFEGFDKYDIDSTIVNENGVFQLEYRAEDHGMGYIAAEDNNPFIVILAPDEDLRLEGETLDIPQTVTIKSGRQNQLFGKYATEHPLREQALSAWDFLERIYCSDPLFAIYGNPKTTIQQEKKRIQEEDRAFLQSIDSGSYVSWYLPVRKLVSSVPTVAQYLTEEIPSYIAAFRDMDYTDQRLYKSGLLRETIDAHFWLIENSGRSLDSVFVEINKSIDLLVDNISTDRNTFNKIIEYLYSLLESRSLYKSSEYLALKVLNEYNHIVDNDLAEQLEHYRIMKIGNTASDFKIEGEVLAPGYDDSEIPQKISNIKKEFIVLVFGSSQCQSCHDELLQIAGFYEKWKAYGVEVVFFSLDDDKHLFNNLAGSLPFISVCDLKKWESPVVKAYRIFAMPTIYLLDSNLKILLRPNSARHTDAWVDWYLVQGNK